MRFNDLTKSELREIAFNWPDYTPAQRQQIADSLDVSESYLSRQVAFVRNYENRPEGGKKPSEIVHHSPATVETAKAPENRPVASNSGIQLKSAVFDLECTDFGTEGYSGYLICCSILPLDMDNVTTLRIEFDDHSDDRRLVRETIAALSQYDILIGHNVAAFDFNWLHSRWLFHNSRESDVGDWQRWLYVDTYQSAKSSAIKTSKRLGNLGDYFGLKGVKTSIYRTAWNDVRSPYKTDFDRAMGAIVYHCEQDVLLNRGLFDVLWADALSMRTNPLKMTKWGNIPGCKRSGAAIAHTASPHTLARAA